MATDWLRLPIAATVALAKTCTIFARQASCCAISINATLYTWGVCPAEPGGLRKCALRQQAKKIIQAEIRGLCLDCNNIDGVLVSLVAGCFCNVLLCAGYPDILHSVMGREDNSFIIHSPSFLRHLRPDGRPTMLPGGISESNRVAVASSVSRECFELKQLSSFVRLTYGCHSSSQACAASLTATG